MGRPSYTTQKEGIPKQARDYSGGVTCNLRLQVQLEVSHKLKECASVGVRMARASLSWTLQVSLRLQLEQYPKKEHKASDVH